MGDEGRDGRATLRDVFALLRDPDLDPEEKVVWGLYRSYESPNGRGAFPGDELLAEHLGKSPRSVQRYRAHLVELGYLERQLRGPRPARFRAVLPDDEGEASDASDPEDEPEGSDQGGGETTWPTPSKLPKDESGQYVYPDAFERCWELYPSRKGGNPKKGAYGAWRARVTDGADPEELEAGTRRYARFVRKTDPEPQYVKMAQTFYGPKGFWDEDWSVNGDDQAPDDPISSRQDATHHYGGSDE